MSADGSIYYVVAKEPHWPNSNSKSHLVVYPPIHDEVRAQGLLNELARRSEWTHLFAVAAGQSLSINCLGCGQLIILANPPPELPANVFDF